MDSKIKEMSEYGVSQLGTDIIKRARKCMLRPTGYYVLVKMEIVEREVKDGALKGFVLSTTNENTREQTGHDVGIVMSLGPTAFSGYQGIDGETALDRAQQWGVDVGGKVEFSRYDGKIPSHPDYKDYRIIQDAHIIGVIEE